MRWKLKILVDFAYRLLLVGLRVVPECALAFFQPSIFYLFDSGEIDSGDISVGVL